jgi:hypothetical protein
MARFSHFGFSANLRPLPEDGAEFLDADLSFAVSRKVSHRDADTGFVLYQHPRVNIIFTGICQTYCV